MPKTLSEHLHALSEELAVLAASADTGAPVAVPPSAGADFFTLLMALVLACFVGYYVVWRVTPALHSPLMGVTNAISSVIIVGALIAAGPESYSAAKWFGFVAVTLASVNIFGGFMVTHRMLGMFKRNPSKRS